MTTPAASDRTAHTPTPWRYEMASWAKSEPAFGFAIVADGKLPAVCSAGVHERHTLATNHFMAPDQRAQYFEPEEIAANAEFIVRAVNSHDALVRELRHLVNLLEPLERDGGLHVPGLATLNGARAALALAEQQRSET